MPNDPPVTRVLFGDRKPGQTPIANFTALKVQGITTLRELDFHEAKNVFNAIVDYLKQEGRKRIEFDLESVKAVHRDMFCDVWEWAGQFRTCNLNIGCRWTQVQEKLYALLEDMKVWSDYNNDVFEQASWLHHKVVQIHPFLNGNGRWSRLLTNIWLLEKQIGVIEWPSDIGSTSPVRNEYLRALEAADNGEYDALMELHRRFIPRPHQPLVVQQPDNPAMRHPGKVITVSTILPPDVPPSRPIIVRPPDESFMPDPGRVTYRSGRPPLPPSASPDDPKSPDDAI